MRQGIFLIAIALFFFSACNSENPYRHYKDNEMIGNVLEIQDEKTILIDISEWEKRGWMSSYNTDEGYFYTVKITDETDIMFKDGTNATMEDVKTGQKVLVNPPKRKEFEGSPKELILLDMTFEEKYAGLLPSDGYRIVVMQQKGGIMSVEEEVSILDMLSLKPKINASWMEYDKDYIVDFQKELDIKEFPALLVFDEEGLIFQTSHIEELKAYVTTLKNE